MRAGVEVIGVERQSIPQALAGRAYISGLSQSIADRAAGRPVHLVGFSMGGCIALKLASLGQLPISRLDLIAPAGPLDLGGPYEMAGGPLFQMARNSPQLFRLITAIQSIAARLAPGLIYRTLFSAARASDQIIAADPEFQARLRAILRAGFGPGYVRDMMTYVTDWRGELAAVTCETHIWQGDQDNWVPPAMAEAIGRALPNLASFRTLEGQSHYGALKTAWPLILDEVGKET